MQWFLGLLVVLIAVGLPTAYYRTVYENYRRFREVTPGKFYRSGQLTELGFKQVVQQYRIKTVINLQQENRDPFMPVVWSAPSKTRESELCESLGVNYQFLFGGELIPEAELAAGKRPRVIDQYLRILDDPNNYPILLHCKAGLHRTGLLTAVYRMEYEKRSPAAVMQELRANGYGTFMASLADDYVIQFIDRYKPGIRVPVPSGSTTGAPEPILAPTNGGRP